MLSHGEQCTISGQSSHATGYDTGRHSHWPCVHMAQTPVAAAHLLVLTPLMGAVMPVDNAKLPSLVLFYHLYEVQL